MTSVSSRTGERGSVLVVCLGILVVLSLMATAFISSVSVQKDASVSTRRSVIVEMAAISGQAAVLNGASIGLADTVSTDKVAHELWRFAGVSEADLTALGFVAGVQYRTWKVITCYDKDLKNKSAVVNLADLSYPIWVRIAYAEIDCEGLWCLNPPAGPDMAVYKADLEAYITATGLTGVNANKAAAVVDTKVYSWLHARDVYVDGGGGGTDAEIDKMMFILSPFGTNAGKSGGTDKISIFSDNSPTMVTAAHTDGLTEIAGTSGNLWRATVRAQIWDNAHSKVLAEKQMEFVYVKSNDKVVYQRWVANE